VVAVAAGAIAGSVALLGFCADSAIEVISAVGLLWRLRRAGPDAEVGEESAAEKRAFYVVAVTFFVLAAYIAWEAISGLAQREEPLMSPICIALSVLAPAIMPVPGYAKQRTLRAPVADDRVFTAIDTDRAPWRTLLVERC